LACNASIENSVVSNVGIKSKYISEGEGSIRSEVFVQRRTMVSWLCHSDQDGKEEEKREEANLLIKSYTYCFIAAIYAYKYRDIYSI